MQLSDVKEAGLPLRSKILFLLRRVFLGASFLVIALLAIVATRFYTGRLFSDLHCTTSGTDQKLSSEASILFRKMNLSGAFLISKQGEILSKEYCGIADPKTRLEVTSETRFNIGSVTKQFTGYLLHELVSEGKVSLEEPISRYLPELETSPSGPITVGQLVKMTSGLPDVFPMKYFIGTQISSRIHTEEEFLSAVKETKLESRPGEKFSYSNVGYSLLGVLIGRVERKAWADSIRQRIFLSLGMSHTSIEGVDPARSPQLATGLLSFNFESSLGSFHLALPHWNYSMIKGAGGIVSTVDDLYLWNKALTARQKSDPTWAKTYFPSGLPGAENYLYGWFWNEMKLPNGKKISVLSHGGEDPGYCAVDIRLPGKDTFIIVTLNSDYCALKEGSLRPFLSFAAGALIE